MQRGDETIHRFQSTQDAGTIGSAPEPRANGTFERALTTLRELAGKCRSREIESDVEAHEDLERVIDDLAAHERSTEGRKGLFAQLEKGDPTLSPNLARMRRQHRAIATHARLLSEMVHEGLRAESLARACDKLSREIRAHEREESDLVFEAWWRDTGAAD